MTHVCTVQRFSLRLLICIVACDKNFIMYARGFFLSLYALQKEGM